MKIFVTGGAGFIGSHIVESLVKAGHEVLVYDNFSTGTLDNLKEVNGHIEIIEGDILNYDLLEKSMSKCDVVSHQAAQLEIFRSTDDPEFDLEVNTIGTLNILKAAKKTGIQKIVNASSACIYGQVEGLTPETHIPSPNWAYGVSKLAAEKYCDIYSQYEKLPVVNLRYGITYGEREWYRRVLTIMVKRAVQGMAPVVFGDGSQVRDFIYVGDLVRMHNECMINPKANGESFNVGTGIGTSILELGKEIISAAGMRVDVILENTSEGEFSKLVPDKKRNTQELKVMLLGVEKAKKLLGWEPTFTLQDGLQRMIPWAKNNLSRWDKVFYSKTPN